VPRAYSSVEETAAAIRKEAEEREFFPHKWIRANFVSKFGKKGEAV